MRYIICRHCNKLYNAENIHDCPNYIEPKRSSVFCGFFTNVFKCYTTKSFNGEPIRVRGSSEENKLLDKHKLIRMEDFNNTFKETKQDKNIRELKEMKKDDSLSLSFKDGGEVPNELKFK